MQIMRYYSIFSLYKYYTLLDVKVHIFTRYTSQQSKESDENTPEKVTQYHKNTSSTPEDLENEYQSTF